MRKRKTDSGYRKRKRNVGFIQKSVEYMLTHTGDKKLRTTKVLDGEGRKAVDWMRKIEREV